MRRFIGFVVACLMTCMVFAEGTKLKFSYDKFEKLKWTEGKELISEQSTRSYSHGLYDYFIEQIYKDPVSGNCDRVLYSIGKIQSIKFNMKGWDGIDTSWIYGVTVENIGQF